MGLKAWAAKAPLAHLGDVYLYRDRVRRIGRGGGEHPLDGVRAQVESIGQIRDRATLTRTIATGGAGLFLFKKKIDERELFLTIEGPEFQWVVDVDPTKQSEARRFAAQVNTAARSLVPEMTNEPHHPERG